MENEQVGKRTFSVKILSFSFLSVNYSEDGNSSGESAAGGFLCLYISAWKILNCN